MAKQTEKTRKKLGTTMVVSPSRTLLLPAKTAFKNGSNSTHIERPYRINPETPEEREKRLEKRKALTLKVFKWAFDNNNIKG